MNLIYAMFNGLEIFNVYYVHTGAPSLSPMSEKTKQAIHYPRIWEGVVSRTISIHGSLNP